MIKVGMFVFASVAITAIALMYCDIYDLLVGLLGVESKVELCKPAMGYSFAAGVCVVCLLSLS